jgi:hypothetical protein
LLFIYSCSNKNQEQNLPEIICETILKVHEEYPFKIDKKENAIILGNFINVYYPFSKDFNEFYITVRGDEMSCDNLKFKLIEGTIDISPSYKFVQRISYSIDEPIKGKVVLSRGTYENDSSNTIGHDNRLGENFYLSKSKGKWIIDSLTYDISM